MRTIKPTNIYSFTVPAYGTYRLLVAGEYFKLLESTGAVDVLADWGRLSGLIAGQGLEDSPFGHLLFTDVSGQPNTVRVVIGDERFIDGMAGTFSIGSNTVPRSGGFSNTQKTVTNASAQLVAGNLARQYLLVQNKSASGDVYLSFANPATVANGVRVVAGGFWEIATVAPTGALYAIGSAANNPDVVVVEG